MTQDDPEKLMAEIIRWRQVAAALLLEQGPVDPADLVPEILCGCRLASGKTYEDGLADSKGLLHAQAMANADLSSELARLRGVTHDCTKDHCPCVKYTENPVLVERMHIAQSIADVHSRLRRLMPSRLADEILQMAECVAAYGDAGGRSGTVVSAAGLKHYRRACLSVGAWLEGRML